MIFYHMQTLYSRTVVGSLFWLERYIQGRSLSFQAYVQREILIFLEYRTLTFKYGGPPAF